MVRKRAKSKHIVSKCGPPMGKYMNRPSIEYSGSGDQLCFDGWGGRWFRASIDAVKEGIQMLRDGYADGNPMCYNDLYNFWNICDTDMGAYYGWPVSIEDEFYCDMEFIVELYEVGHHDLADKMGESVLVIEPDPRTSLPIEHYMEV